MKIKIDSRYSQLLGAMLLFGFAGSSHAVSCSGGVGSTTDVMIDTGIVATSCGTGSTTQDQTGMPVTGWQVNIDNAGGINTWAYYEREENDDANGTNPPGNNHDGNTTAIDLMSEEIGDGFPTGDFSLNAFDPFLIVLKSDQANYQWYYFEGLSGPQTGTWDDSVFEPNSLSHISAYTQFVPVPAAVWLFGSGLIGLVGIARRKRNG